MVGDITTTDAAAWSHTQANDTVGQVTETLIYLDETLKPLPKLAESWELNANQSSIKLNLRKGVQFHSGREFTSEDVNYNLLRARDPKLTTTGLIAPGSAWWTKIEMPDKNTIILTSDQPRPGVVDWLNFLRIQDKDIREGANAANAVGGTGPFKWVERVANDHISMARHTSYWDTGKPYLDEYRVNVYATDAAQVAAFESGALEAAWLPPLAETIKYRADPRYKVIDTNALGQFFYASLNTNVAPTDNKQIRQAIGYAINRKAWAETIMKGFVQPTNLPWATVSPAYDAAKNNKYPFDLDKAKALVAQSGVSNPEFDVAWATSGFPAEYAALGAMLEADFAKAGMKVNLKPTAPADFGAPGAGLRPTFNGMRISAGAFAHLPEAATEFLVSRTMGFVSNASGYYDSSFDKLVTTAMSEPDAAKRKTIYGQINDFLLDAAYCHVLSNYADIIAMKANVQDLKYEQSSTVNLRNVWLA